MKTRLLSIFLLTALHGYVWAQTATTTETTAPASETTTVPAMQLNQPQSSSVEKNKDAARVWYEEAIVKNNLQPLDNILDKDVIVVYAPSFKSSVTNSNKLTGIDQVKQHLNNIHQQAGFSGSIIYLVGEGNNVAVYRMVTEKLPNGKSVDVPWASFFEFNNEGKITKITHVNDTLTESQFNQSAYPTTTPVNNQNSNLNNGPNNNGATNGNNI